MENRVSLEAYQVSVSSRECAVTYTHIYGRFLNCVVVCVFVCIVQYFMFVVFCEYMLACLII